MSRVGLSFLLSPIILPLFVFLVSKVVSFPTYADQIQPVFIALVLVNYCFFAAGLLFLIVALPVKRTLRLACMGLLGLGLIAGNCGVFVMFFWFTCISGKFHAVCSLSLVHEACLSALQFSLFGVCSGFVSLGLLWLTALRHLPISPSKTVRALFS